MASTLQPTPQRFASRRATYAGNTLRRSRLGEGLLYWFAPLPPSFGTQSWIDNVSGRVATLQGITGSSATSGWQSGAARPGSYGHMRFGGSPQHVLIETGANSIAVPDIGEKTVACWIMQTTLGGSQTAITFNSTSRRFILGSSIADGNTFRAGTSAGIFVADTSTVSIVAGQWYNMAVTVRQQDVIDQIYINGMPCKTAGISSLGGDLNSFAFGCQFAVGVGTLFWIGGLDDIMFHTRLLSASDVQELYHSSLSGHPSLLRPSRGGMHVVPRTFISTSLTVTVQPARMAFQAATLLSTQILSVSPSRMAFQAATATIPRLATVTPAQMAFKAAQTVPAAGQQVVTVSPPQILIRANDVTTAKFVTVALTPATMILRANDLIIAGRSLVVQPARMTFKAATAQALTQILLRDCGAAYDAALAQKFIAGDWLVQAPDIGLKLGFHYNPDGTWEHRLADIGQIEISAPWGGGMASVANVSIKVLEDGTGMSILELWEANATVEGVELTIDFILDTQSNALRIFTGRIDAMTLIDAITEINCVDDSIHRDLLIPQQLITSEVFPNADAGALTQPMPLVYGSGVFCPGAPLLFIDTLTNTYLVAGHPFTLSGSLAIFDTTTNLFLALPGILALNNPSTATITLGTLDTGVMTIDRQSDVTAAGAAIDGFSNTLATIGTAGALDSNGLDGIGYLGITAGSPGYPRTPTIQVTLTNHRRSPSSDPTVVGVFTVRTVDANSGGALRTLLTTSGYRQVTSAQTDVFTLSNVAVGINEILEVLGTIRNEGSLGTASQTYEIGEVSITPLVAYSANVSGKVTAITLPFGIQDTRFNHVSHSLYVVSQMGVSLASNAVDGFSTTLAFVNTSAFDSNLDGIGELVIGAMSSVSQRANNTVVVTMLEHRRSVSSDPTVTGQFTIQTLNADTGVVLRENLFVSPQFRQQLRPLSTSFTAPSINLGGTAQLSVRLVARNEGGPGNDLQTYEVGEIQLDSYFQPQGDAGVLYLTGAWTGRFAPDNNLLAYAGLAAGTLLTQPDQVVASILVQELSASVNSQRFAEAYNWYAAHALHFDGGIGAGWSVQRAQGRQLLYDLAKQGAAILAPTFDGTFSLRPYRGAQPAAQSFDISNILYTQGAQDQRAEERQSTFEVFLGDLQNVHTRFEVHYAYNVGNGKYDKVYVVDENGSTLPDTSANKGTVEGLCQQSFQRYGPLEPLVVNAYWISDDFTAEYLLVHLVTYWAQQRVRIQFETTLKAICLEVGDFINVTYPTLPASDDGKDFELHTIRYLPVVGRVQLTASKVATLGTAILVGGPPASRAASGITRMAFKAATPIVQTGSVVVTVQPAKMGFAVAGNPSGNPSSITVTLVAFSEPWEFNPAFDPDAIVVESWTL